MHPYDLAYERNLRESIRLADEAGHDHPEAKKLLAEALAARFTTLSPLERTLAANDPANGPTAVRILALTMVEDDRG
jgi:hypothetical protein